MPQKESEKFINGIKVDILYLKYSGNGCGLPVFNELSLPAGNYTLGFVNPEEVPTALHYQVERWKEE